MLLSVVVKVLVDFSPTLPPSRPLFTGVSTCVGYERHVGVSLITAPLPSCSRATVMDLTSEENSRPVPWYVKVADQ